MLAIPSYVTISPLFNNLFKYTLGDKAGGALTALLDPTNAFSIAALRPHVKDVIDVAEYISYDESLLFDGGSSPFEELIYNRNAGALGAAGTIRDAIHGYSYYTLDKLNPIGLNAGAAAFWKYTAVYICREAIPSSAFIARNGLCAGVSEGSILATNMFFKEEYNPVNIAIRINFEWLAYDSADRVRSFTREYISETLLHSYPDYVKVFVSELAYGITIASYRIFRAEVESAVKEIYSDSKNIITDEFNGLINSILDLSYEDIAEAIY